MIAPAYVIDATTGETIATFGVEQEPGDYLPQRWMLARRYTVPATGPGEHTWGAWVGALAMLLAVFALLGSHV